MKIILYDGQRMFHFMIGRLLWIVMRYFERVNGRPRRKTMLIRLSVCSTEAFSLLEQALHFVVICLTNFIGKMSLQGVHHVSESRSPATFSMYHSCLVCSESSSYWHLNDHVFQRPNEDNKKVCWRQLYWKASFSAIRKSFKWSFRRDPRVGCFRDSVLSSGRRSFRRRFVNCGLYYASWLTCSRSCLKCTQDCVWWCSKNVAADTDPL